MALLKANTGIGTTNPTSALHVIGDGLITGVVTATTFNGQINAGVSTLGIVSATNLTSQQLLVSGISTLGVTSVTNLTAQSVNSSGIVTGSSFRPSSGYYQSPNGTNAFYVYDGTGNVAFQGTIGASQVNNASGFKVIGFAGTDITFENDARVGNNLYVAGVSTFVGAITGTISTATKLETARTFEITGDIVASPIAFDGTGNVSLAATIQPDSVGLGTDTFGDYVKDISGTSQQIVVTGGTGEGSTPTLSLPTNLVVPQDLTVTRDLQVNRNLNVDGNITIGGTTAFINVQQVTVTDPDIVLGYRTDAFGNDISNDTTSNHGGVALASTEGTPLLDLFIAGIETNPATYKKIMWFKEGTFAGLGTDAWLINYAVGIGSTQFPTGTRLAAGSVQFTENDLAVVRNINASGIITASSGFIGNLTGTASTASFATTAFNLTNAENIITGTINSARLSGTYNIDISGNAATATNAGFATYANVAGVATYASAAGVATYASLAGIATYADNAGIATYASLAGIATYADNAGIATYASLAGVATYADNAGVSTSVVGGIASVTQLNVSGISTLGVVTSGNIYSTGIVTALDFVGNLTGTASTASFATTAFTLNGVAAESLSVGFARSSGISTNLKGGVAGNVPYQSATDTTTFVTNGLSGQVLLFNGSAPIWGNVSAATGSFGGVTVYDEGNLVGTAGSIASLNFVSPNLSVTATSGASGIATITMADNLVGTALSISGISTIGGDLSVGSGITMYASGGIISATAFYGSGLNLTDLILARIEGINVQNEGSNIVGFSSFTTLNFVGDYVNATGIGSTATITFSAPGFASTAGVSTSVIGGIASVTQLSVSGISTLGVTTVTNLTTQNINNSGITSTNSLNIGATQVISSARQLQNIASLDATTTATIEAAIQNAPNTFTDLNVTGISTLGVTSATNLTAQQLNISGVSTFAGITTSTSSLFANQLSVAGVSTFAGITTVTGNTLFTRQLSVSGVSTFAGIATHTAGLFGTTASFTGIVTASSFRGDGSQLSNIVTGVSISTNTTNSNQYIPYATSFGSTTGFGVTTLFVFNPSTDNLGIGTTNPLQTLHVQGNLLVAAGSATTQHITQKAYELQGGALSWEGSAGQLFSITNNLTSGSIFSVNDVSGIPSIDVNADGTVTLAPYADGNVGIATTLPTSRLHVVGGALITGVSTVGNFRMTPVGTGATVGGIGVTYYGDGSLLTGVAAGFSISTNTTNSNQYIPYATSFGSTTGFGATTLLVYNPSTTRLGIGTTNPTQTLQVGTGSSIVIIDSLGDVGIGTTNATSKLHVIGSALITGVSTIGNFIITPVGTGATVGQAGIITYYGDGSNLSNTNGFSTSLSSDPASPLYRIYKETRRLNVSAGVHTVSSDSDHDNLAFTKADIIVVSSGATFVVSSGTTFRTNIIDLFPANQNLDVTAQNLNVLGITTLGITSISQLNVTGTSTFAGITTSTSSLFANQLSVAGLSTFAGITTVTGTTLFTRQLSVSGVSTVGNFRMTPVGTGATVGGIGVTYFGDGSQLTGISDSVYKNISLGNISGITTINLNNGTSVSATVVGLTTFTFTVNSSLTATQSMDFVLKLTNGGSYAITYPTSVKWENGIAPTLTGVGTDLLGFFTDNQGTQWLGSLLLKDVR